MGLQKRLARTVIQSGPQPDEFVQPFRLHKFTQREQRRGNGQSRKVIVCKMMRHFSMRLMDEFYA